MATAAQRIVTKDDNLPPPLVTLAQLRVDFAPVIKAVEELEAEFAKMPPVLEDDEDLGAVTATVGKIAKYVKRCDEIRLEQGKPHRDAQDVLMKFFRDDLSKRLTDASGKLEARAKPYLKKKRDKAEAERRAIEAEAQRKADEARALASAAIQGGDVQEVKQAVAHSNAMDNFAAKAANDAAASSTELSRVKTTAGTASLQEFWTFEVEDINTIDLEALRPFLPQTAIEQALRAFIKAGRREIKGARIFNDDRLRTRT